MRPWRFKSSPAHPAPPHPGGVFFLARGYPGRVNARRVAESGLVGMRGRIGRRVADEVGRRTPVDAERVAMLVGAYLVVSRVRNLLRMVRRYRASG